MDTPSNILNRLTSLFGSRRSATYTDRGPQVDLLRRHAAERAHNRDLQSALDALDAREGPDATDPEPINRLLPVRIATSDDGDRTLPVELRSGPEPHVMALVEPDTAHTEDVLPYRLDVLTNTLSIAVAAPLTTQREKALRALIRPKLGYAPALSAYVMPVDALRRLVRLHYDDHSRTGIELAAGTVHALATTDAARPVLATSPEGEASTHDLVVNLLAYATEHRARDLLISPHYDETKLFIINERGKQEIPLARRLPRASAHYLTRVVKGMCNTPLDVLKTREAQKGTITRILETSRGAFELSARVNITPKDFGEFVDIRLFLDDVTLEFDELVRCEFSRNWIRWAVAESANVLLFASPPGEGKSTLQHAILRPPLVPSRDNVLSIENPIERRNPHIEQFPTSDIMTQEMLLDQHLQNSPDRFMVGEMTTSRTARLVFEGARASIQMYTTVHANSAADAIPRLRDLGISREDIASHVGVVVSQRLLPKVCEGCKEEDPVPPEVLLALQFHSREIDTFVPMRGAGCDLCNHSGIDGKVGIIETLPLTDEIRTLVRTAPKQTLVSDVTLAAIGLGMTPLRRHAIDLVARGVVPLAAMRRMARLSEDQLVAWWLRHRRHALRLLTAPETE